MHYRFAIHLFLPYRYRGVHLPPYGHMPDTKGSRACGVCYPPPPFIRPKGKGERRVRIVWAIWKWPKQVRQVSEGKEISNMLYKLFNIII